MFRIQPKITQDVIRPAFRRIRVTEAPVPKEHSHGPPAAERTTGRHWIFELASFVHVRVFSHFISAKEQRDGVDGYGLIYHGKDLVRENSSVPLWRQWWNSLFSDEPVLHYFGDCDMYLDMPAILASLRGPVIIYTPQPRTPAGRALGVAWTFSKDGKLHWKVGGSTEYAGWAWSYQTDCIIAERTFLGIPVAATVYLVERYTGVLHDVILLAPTGHFRVGALLTRYMRGQRVVRYTPVSGNFAALHDPAGTGDVSVARCGDFTSATLPYSQYEAASAMARMSKMDVLPGTIASWIKGEDKEVKGVILCEYFRERMPPKPFFVFPVDLSMVVTYIKGDRPSMLVDDKAPMVPFMAPLVFAKVKINARSAENDDYTIAKRMVGPVEKRDKLAKEKGVEIAMSESLRQHMDAFADLYVGLHRGNTAADVEEVYDRQGRPTQRLKLDESASLGPSACEISKYCDDTSFDKVEAIKLEGATRNITMSPKMLRILEARLTYPLAMLQARQKFCGHSRSDYEVAERVAELADRSKRLSIRDAEKLDTTKSTPAQYLELAVAFRFYNLPTFREFQKMAANRRRRHTTLRFGRRVHMGDSQGSGFFNTTTDNTLFCAFVAFLGFVLSGMTYEEAFDALGIYAGDDALDALADEYAKEAGLLVGISFSFEDAVIGGRCPEFLNRFYVNAFYGGRDSYANPARAVDKVHMTITLPPGVTPLMKLHQRIDGWRRGDSNSPVLGDFVKHWDRVRVGHEARLALPAVHSDVARHIRRYEAEGEAYPNEPTEAYWDDCLRRFPEYDWDRLLIALAQCQVPEDFLELPVILEGLLTPLADVGNSMVGAGQSVFGSLNTPALTKERLAAHNALMKNLPPIVFEDGESASDSFTSFSDDHDFDDSVIWDDADHDSEDDGDVSDAKEKASESSVEDVFHDVEEEPVFDDDPATLGDMITDVYNELNASRHKLPADVWGYLGDVYSPADRNAYARWLKSQSACYRAAWVIGLRYGVETLGKCPAYRFGADGQDIIAMVSGEASNPGPVNMVTMWHFTHHRIIALNPFSWWAREPAQPAPALARPVQAQWWSRGHRWLAAHPVAYEELTWSYPLWLTPLSVTRARIGQFGQALIARVSGEASTPGPPENVVTHTYFARPAFFAPGIQVYRSFRNWAARVLGQELIALTSGEASNPGPNWEDAFSNVWRTIVHNSFAGAPVVADPVHQEGTCAALFAFAVGYCHVAGVLSYFV